MTTIIDGNNVLYDTTALDDTDSTHTTQGEEFYTVDTSNGTLTVELSTADTTPGFHKRFVDVGGNIETNAVTFTTEGGEQVDGGASIAWDHNNGSYVDLWSDGTDWFTSLQAAADKLVVDTFGDSAGNTIADFTGERLTVDGSNVLNVNNEVTAIDNTDSPHTTSGEDIIEVDSSGGAVTVTLASADADAGRTITVLDDNGSAATNTITVNTEGAETIDPGGASSKTITVDHAAFAFESNGTNWNQLGANALVESVDAGTVTADKAVIGGVAVEKVDTFTNSTRTTSSVEAEFTGLNQNVQYLLKLKVQDRNTGALQIQFNGDQSASNANYEYFDETGTKQTSQDEIEAIDFAQFGFAGGQIWFAQWENSIHTGINNDFIPGRVDRINGFAQKGGWNGGTNLSSIQITATGGMEGSTGGSWDSTIELWKAI